MVRLSPVTISSSSPIFFLQAFEGGPLTALFRFFRKLAFFKVIFRHFFEGSQYRSGCFRIEQAFLSRIALEIFNVRGM